MNIVHTLLESTKKAPNHSAIVYKNETKTYSELTQQMLQLAGGFKRVGIKKGAHVGMMISNRPEYIITYYALLAVGATVIPINPLFKRDELTYILINSDAEALIFDTNSIKTVQNAMNELENVKTFIYLGENQSADMLSWQDLSKDEPLKEIAELDSEDLAQIIYTSGTTGRPKGAMITQGNINWMSKTCLAMSNLTPNDRILLVLPLYHAYAKLQGMVAPFRIGATVYLEERFYPDEILTMIAEEKITNFMGVPTMYAMFVNSPKITEYDYSSLKYCGSGGASLPLEIMEKVNKLMGVEVMEGYGQTESTVMISRTRKDGERRPGSVGLPIPGIELKIVDTEGNEVTSDNIGEIIFRGPNAMKGYYKKPEETSQTIKNGWVYTGDLGRIDDQGHIYIVDRRKEMIIRGGFNVYPREVEEVLYTHKAVVECAVIGEADPIFGEEIAAFIVTKEAIDKDSIISFCKEHLVHYKVPRNIYFIDELPKNATGKIMKNAIKMMSKLSVENS
ncbi:long-chain-fatty-acid--CoA ligase [Solibacillus sp. FSL K6-1523]|uniref:long-chain-fatty-acid--CoA ligase n=1 Tax=Solibacillus sp. FSL K6-1523 TaxID=2921471 RepID=UPI0030F4E65F